MSDALFFRILSYENKENALEEIIESINTGSQNKLNIYAVDCNSFCQLHSSPFAYWVSDHFREIFKRLPPLSSEMRSIKQGVATADDFRFVRTWWEIEPKKVVAGEYDTKPGEYGQQTFQGKRWVPFAKGGVYSPYYSDLHLVVNWEQDGREIKNFKDLLTGKVLSRPQNTDFYFRSGLTWSDRTTKLFSCRPLPAGGIFSVKGSAGFFAGEELFVLGLMNSLIFNGLLSLMVGAGDAAARSYQVGIIGLVPFINLSNENIKDYTLLKSIAYKAVNLKRFLDTANETSHVFQLPALLRVKEDKLVNCVDEWQNKKLEIEEYLQKCQIEVDEISFRLYNIDHEDRRVMEKTLKSGKQIPDNNKHETELEEREDDIAEIDVNIRTLTSKLLSYIIGCSLGRWDVRVAIGERLGSDLPDPFAPLPVCAPGMLMGDDGLPLQETPTGYPLRINWDGILVDDPEHRDDIVQRMREVLAVIWRESAEAIEQEACYILGVKELREYFRRPSHGGFWVEHIQRYSKSRRKAPIYWLLQSSKKNYAIWLYYHRLNKDSLFKVLQTVVEPKLRREEAVLEQLRTQLVSVGNVGREAKMLERQLEKQESFLSELEDFRDKLHRAADLNLEPDLNDGVVLNAAPLWEVMPWSEPKRYWQELLAGKYEWSSIGKQLRAKGLV